MLNRNARTAVIGAGAIGGVTAAFLKIAGWNPQLVCKHQQIVDRATSKGLLITGVRGDHVVSLDAVRNISELSGSPDLVFLATKATDCVQAARELAPYLKKDSVIVSLQNGICEDDLGAVLGRERVMGCVVGWGASLLGPGKMEVTSKGEFVIGNIDNRADENLPFVRDMLDPVAPARISGNIMGELYAKLIINACINSLGVITGQRLGKLLAGRKVRNIFVALMQEAMAVADNMGLKVEKGAGGRIDYYEFLGGNGFLKNFKRHLFIRAIGFRYRRIKSSSLQSIERGRRTEVDYLNGYIVGQAQKKQVDTPVNSVVVEMIRQIEAGTRKMGPENLNDPVFNRYS